MNPFRLDFIRISALISFILISICKLKERGKDGDFKSTSKHSLNFELSGTTLVKMIVIGGFLALCFL